MATAPKVVVMLYRCELCGRPQAKPRRVCTPCYRAGRTLRGGKCAICGKPHPEGHRNRTFCPKCLERREKQQRAAYWKQHKDAINARRLKRERIMEDASVPLRCDTYAQTHEPISDEEYDAKVRMLRELRAAEVHCGDCGHPTRRHFVEFEGTGGFGVLANQHMRGAEAGTGTDRGKSLNSGRFGRSMPQHQDEEDISHAPLKGSFRRDKL